MGPTNNKNPRKFRDKIALQNKLQDAKDQEFNAIMKEVSGVKVSRVSESSSECSYGRNHHHEPNHSCCLHTHAEPSYLQEQGFGPMRHRGGEQRTSPYERSRSLSPGNIRHISGDRSSNVPVILTPRQSSNHLEIPHSLPLLRQKSDPNLYDVNRPQLRPTSPAAGHQTGGEASVQGRSLYVGSVLSEDETRSRSGLLQRRGTAGDIYSVDKEAPIRKHSEPNPPLIIVTQYNHSEQSPYLANQQQPDPFNTGFRHQRSASPLNPGELEGLELYSPGQSPQYEYDYSAGSPGTEENLGLVDSFQTFQIREFLPKQSQQCVSQQFDTGSLRSGEYLDLNLVSGDGRVDIDQLLESELQKIQENSNLEIIDSSLLNIPYI